MIGEKLKELLLDRLSIKSTQRLKRRLKHHELNRFLNRYGPSIDKIIGEAERNMDRIILKFLDEQEEK